MAPLNEILECNLAKSGNELHMVKAIMKSHARCNMVHEGLLSHGSHDWTLETQKAVSHL
mgnify:CR=1 FL=1